MVGMVWNMEGGGVAVVEVNRRVYIYIWFARIRNKEMFNVCASGSWWVSVKRGRRKESVWLRFLQRVCSVR